MKNFHYLLIAAFLLIGAVLISGCTDHGTGGEDHESADTRIITDMRGRTVEIPSTIERVVCIDDGFVEGIMYRFGEHEKVVGVGGEWTRDYTYSFDTVGGESYEYTNGMNPVSYLIPELADLPVLVGAGTGMNYETLASLEPDVIFLRMGAWAFRAGDEENLQKTIHTIESLGYPLVILVGPPYQDEPTIDQIGDEIRIIGEVFSKQDDADALADYLDAQISEIRKRTQGIPEDEKVRMIQLGLSPRARQGGGAGMVWGKDTIESYFIEEIANAKNVYEGTGAFVVVSTEQILALDPDVIVLPTAQGYHPASELYTAPYYQNLQELTAVKNERVYALPWTPFNWAKRLEYPIEAMVIAKAAYPDRFSDINVGEWTLEFYQEVYRVDEATARELRSVQWLDWMAKENF
ncbi:MULTISPECIES: ABC transporter substrate-binding protein [Methanocalculus]|uniref:ABC transporter substrate-binding protein n=1 Tax=Methanocalculus TaxID=71151 RepID=UPI00209EBCF2|nr:MULTISPECIES: ABC transporter substrate-binding protein [unclassified Methanocalculus]MCP1661528.1 iron complex transport system substrate-binding protein [Methanocalculus sp. AMF5]